MNSSGRIAAWGVCAITRDDLQRAVAFAEPSALLVPARILRRVIKRDRGLKWFGGGAAARQTCYAIAGQSLGAIVDSSELGRPAGSPWPETAFLVACPEPDELSAMTPGTVLTITWRRLFRARILARLRSMIDSGAIDNDGLSARIEAIGRTEFEEVCAVLRQDGWIDSPREVASAYASFAAVFFDLSRFAPTLRSYTFPAIEHPTAIEKLLLRDLDAASILAATRPAGAPDPGSLPDPDDPAHEHLGDTFAVAPRRGAEAFPKHQPER